MKLKLTVLAVLATIAGIASAQDMQVVKIGHVGPVSGGQAPYGKDNENGVRMAIEDLNAKNLVIGGKKIKFEIVAEDDAADAKQGTAVAQKFCDMKVNGVVGHLNSGVTMPASKIYNECGLPNLTPSSTNPDVTKPGYKTTYRMIASDASIGAGIAFYAADGLKVKKVAVVDDRTSYGQGVADLFSKAATGKNIEIVDRQFTNDKATDFSAILTSIKSKGVDAIFFGGMHPQAGPMLRQMEQLGMTNVKMLAGDGPCIPDLVNMAAKASTLANFYCAEGGLSIDKMPGGKAWKARYDAKYPGQFQVYSPYAYDAAMVLGDAMVRANSVDPKVYVNEIPKTNYKGVTTTVQFDSRGELKVQDITFSNFKGNEKKALN
jgi:branched-chain amino acid transport system substrate-binding protein